MKKFCQIFLLAFCALVLTAVPVLTAFSEPQDYSIYENRTLISARPDLSASSLFSGAYFEGWETYLRDGVWNRDGLLKLSTRLEYAAARLFVNDIHASQDALLPYVVESIDPDTVEEDAARMAQNLADVAAQVENYGGIFLYVGVPNQYSVFRDGYPAYMSSYISEGLDAVRHAFFTALDEAGVAYLDMGAVFANPADYYFKTDHHMTLPGSVETCRAIFEALRSMGIEIPDHLADVSYRTLPNDFYGSRGRKLYGLSPFTESVEVFETASDVPFARVDNGEAVAASLCTLPETDSEPVTYGLFMGGDIAETVLKTGRAELSDALIFGDSYTNAIETVFYTGFDETRSLDLRYYEEETLSAYLDAYHPAVVVCVRDDANYLNFTGNGALS